MKTGKKLSRQQVGAVVLSLGFALYLSLAGLQTFGDSFQIEEVLLTLIFFFL